MPRFEFTRLTDEWLGYLLAHPLAFVLFAATLIGLALWLVSLGARVEPPHTDDGLTEALLDYQARSFQQPARKGFARPTVVRMQDRRNGAV